MTQGAHGSAGADAKAYSAAAPAVTLLRPPLALRYQPSQIDSTKRPSLASSHTKASSAAEAGLTGAAPSPHSATHSRSDAAGPANL